MEVGQSKDRDVIAHRVRDDRRRQCALSYSDGNAGALDMRRIISRLGYTDHFSEIVDEQDDQQRNWQA